MAGADVVLGMIPLARELLRMGAEVVMCANSQPAINDITAPELRALLNQVAAVCPVIKVRFEPALCVSASIVAKSSGGFSLSVCLHNGHY
jgi:hypothetical protein